MPVESLMAKLMAKRTCAVDSTLLKAPPIGRARVEERIRLILFLLWLLLEFPLFKRGGTSTTWFYLYPEHSQKGYCRQCGRY